MSLVHEAETDAERADLAQWFAARWREIGPADPDAAMQLRENLTEIARPWAPAFIYALTLHHVFEERGDAFDEEAVVDTATGIRDTTVWKKLYPFQRDGVVAVLNRLDQYGGCILADSVGLGKTFQALAVIKYYELRNDRVLVLCPKRLRANWTLYGANDVRNILAADRFGYDVLNHTDLSREDGTSGSIDLAFVNWGNYDLVVIDESHHFRNKRSPRQGGTTRYDRLMQQIVRAGVKTRVLMLSATPVNNRLADLRNQVAFATEGRDDALRAAGIASIDATTRRAQKAFNRWLERPDAERTTEALVEALGFDYFALLDRLTIARSRKHVARYYGLAETGAFPLRLPPVNVKADVDLHDDFPAIERINTEIRHLKLAAYAPLRYVLPSKRADYDRRYSTRIRGGESVFRQADREESLIHLMRINLLKRMESAVASFALTLGRQLAGVERLLAQIEAFEEAFDEHHGPEALHDINTVDFDDPLVESLLVGRRVKVLLSDVDLRRWREDLIEDRNRLGTLEAAARAVTPDRDAKLAALREQICAKMQHPLNTFGPPRGDGADDEPSGTARANRKLLIFTAFADTAAYLYDDLADWALETFGVHAALVTGAHANRTTAPGLRNRMSDILTAFAPRAKERPDVLADEGEIDLLIATDCISEGQNLQDCDTVVNYDVHWNPVRIIQRFGRIDRLGSPNERIQLVTFWPNMELEAYINLEQRVSGRMVLLDVSATGEENLIETQSGDVMNDLDYRRRQLQHMIDAVPDLEDFSAGLAITDLTLADFRMDLARYASLAEGTDFARAPLGAYGVAVTHDADLPPGTIFCLRAETEAALRATPPGYPLAPYFLVYVADPMPPKAGAGAHPSIEGPGVLLPFTQARRILEALKRVADGRTLPDPLAVQRFTRSEQGTQGIRVQPGRLAAAVGSVVGAGAERAVASLFARGGTHALAGEYAGADDFEVVAYLAVLPPADAEAPNE